MLHKVITIQVKRQFYRRDIQRMWEEFEQLEELKPPTDLFSLGEHESRITHRAESVWVKVQEYLHGEKKAVMHLSEESGQF